MATPSAPITEFNEGETLTSSNSLLLVLLKPTAMESIGLSHKDETIKVHAFKTEVHQLKTHISRNWPGKPRLEGIRLIARGKILDDRELISVALSSTPGDDFTHPIHVVVRPNCWSEQVSVTPTPARPVSAPPTTAVDAGPLLGAAAPISPFQQTNPLISSAVLNSHDQTQSNPTSTTLPSTPQNTLPSTVPSPHHAIFTHFCNLTRSQRQAFVDNLYKAQFGLVERLETLRLRLYQNQVEVLGLQMHPIQKSFEQDQLAKYEDEKWTVVDEKLTKLLVDLQYWGTYVEPYEPTEFQDYQLSYQHYQQNRQSEFERVEISGLPFLLHIPRNFQIQSNQEHFLRNIGTRVPPSTQVTTFKKLKKEMNRTLHLEKRLHLLILQVKKLEASFSHVDGLVSSTNALVGNLSLGSLGISSPFRLHNAPYLAGANPVPAQQAQGGLGRPPAVPAPGIMQLPPHGPMGLVGVGMGGVNPPALGVAGAGLPVAGAGLGIGPNGMIQMPAEWMMPPNGLAWPHVPMARTRRYEFTINLDNIRRYLAPLLWLSMKLGVLLYVFGRNASFNKRVILIGLAVGWVLWEAFAIGQRYEAQARRRERLQRQQAGAGGGGPVDPVQAVLDRGRRRAQRMREQRLQRDAPAPDNNNLNLPNLPPNGLANPTPTAPAAVPPAAPDSAAAPPPAPAPAAIEAPPAVDPQPARRRNLRAIAEQIRARGGAFPPGTEVRPFRTTSAFSPRYWFNSIAVVGLASEYRELGLHPIGERSLGSSNNLDYPNWYKFLRNLKICLILFFGTLSPEIEKKRKKALEKRTRILKMVIADAARERTNRQPTETNVPLAPIPNTTNQEQNATVIGNENTNDRDTTPITSSVVSASGVDHHSTSDGVNSTLVSRHRVDQPKSIEVNETTNQLNSNESLPIVNNESRPTTTTTSPPTSLPTIVIPPIAGPSTTTTSTSTSTNQENKNDNLQTGLGRAQEEFGGLEPPLTPSNERPGVVPGLDDTDDEDLVVGEDEAGMMLF
ncbi:uncharacterized protein MELLADRAFT_76971 [Melampsora larici-populina 98AG31]|uniref:Ubiquitin-like domain-containing protein n=1 Tax=Melampsora larici-populina (strain 98AG31 / pathotype 3-4-7) TaxID=747676 RepID=F4RBT2_MELLP|nr:uncharacterized protein MELLADRAFT_76971 [Melampsora larici-populina 98AG31]EGG10158.1 hypothetical protein MELLADRAFT_76971 [Melampsora larici-populina 98AG31]